MPHDDERPTPEVTRPGAPEVSTLGHPHFPRSAGRPNGPVDPFRMAIAELQEDLAETGPPVSGSESESETVTARNEAGGAPESPLSPPTGPSATFISREGHGELPGQDETPAPRVVLPVPKWEPIPSPARGSSTPEFNPAPRRVGLLALAAVALLCGLMGGFLALGLRGHDRQVDEESRTDGVGIVSDPHAPSGDQGGPNDALAGNVTALRAQAGRLEKQLSECSERLDSLPTAGPPPDLSDLRKQVDALSRASSATAQLPGRILQLDGGARELDEGLKSIRAEITALRTKVETLTAKGEAPEPAPVAATPSTPASPSVTENRAVPTPAPEDETPSEKPAEDPLERELTLGADLFRQGKPKEALSVFNKLELTHPDDARVWYFAALSHGYATSQWGGGTVRLVEKGVEREQAGTPEATQIDAAFRNLSADRGKGWLDGYRKLVKTR